MLRNTLPEEGNLSLSFSLKYLKLEAKKMKIIHCINDDLVVILVNSNCKKINIILIISMRMQPWWGLF